MQNPEFRSTWFSKTVLSHDLVVGACVLDDGLVEIDRKELPSIIVAPLGNLRIDFPLARELLREASPTAIVLISKSGHYDWDARLFAMDHASTIHTFKELYTFMGEEDPRGFVDKNLSFNSERLAQHSKVEHCGIICEGSLYLERKGTLSDVTIAVEYEYEFSEEAAVRAVGRHPDANIILNANPNGRVTAVAYSYVQDIEVPIFNIGELMGALNYDGDELRDYTAPSKY